MGKGLWRHAMEWVSHSFNIQEEGYYSVLANISANDLLKQISWLIDEEQAAVTDMINFKDETRDVGPVELYLKPGLHTLKINAGIDGWILNSVSLNKTLTNETDQLSGTPFHFTLDQNYPNPFNHSTNIVFSIPVKGNIRLEIFDVLGITMKILADGEFNPGIYYMPWNGKDSEGQEVNSGIYFYRICLNGKIRLTKKMSVMK